MSEISLPPRKEFLTQLEPTVVVAIDAHRKNYDRRKWYPHEHIPYNLAENYPPDYEWFPQDFRSEDEYYLELFDGEIPLGVRETLHLNLLTEDNLPYYFWVIQTMFGRHEFNEEEGPWDVWNKMWTTEEDNHAIGIRGYLTANRGIDPIELEEGREIQMRLGKVPEPEEVLTGLFYVVGQEFATKVSHSNSGHMLDETGQKLLAHIARDENGHFKFYHKLAREASKMHPDAAIRAFYSVLRYFEMPGTGIKDYATKAKYISEAGVFGATEWASIAFSITKSLGILDLEPTSDEAKMLQAEIDKLVNRTLPRSANREQLIREKHAELGGVVLNFTHLINKDKDGPHLVAA